jgi:hypothetical protein
MNEMCIVSPEVLIGVGVAVNIAFIYIYDGITCTWMLGLFFYYLSFGKLGNFHPAAVFNRMPT